jgi:hypothetical protein
MKFGPTFFKTTSLCAFIAGILAVVEWLMMYHVHLEIDRGSLVLGENYFTIAYLWIIAIFSFFMITSYWGITGKKMETTPGLATTGFLFIFTYFVISIITSSIHLFHTGVFELITGLECFSLICYVVGAFLFFLATWKGRGIEKIVSLFFLLQLIVFVHWLVFRHFEPYPDAWFSTMLDVTRILHGFVTATFYFLAGTWLWIKAK